METLLKCLNILLRVPALFIFEVMLVNLRPTADSQREEERKMSLPVIELSLPIITCLCTVSAILYLLPLISILKIYRQVVSICLAAIAHFVSLIFIKEAVSYDRTVLMQKLVLHVVLQIILSNIINHLLALESIMKYIVLIYTVPIIAKVFYFSTPELCQIHHFALLALLIFYVILILMPSLYSLLVDIQNCLLQYSDVIDTYGWLSLFVSLLQKIFVPSQLFVFWCSLFIIDFLKIHASLFDRELSLAFLTMIVICQTCRTLLSLMALCVMISSVSWLIIFLCNCFIEGRFSLVTDSIQQGWAEGITMFLLGSQSDITRLSMEQKVISLRIIVFMIASSLLQSVHEVIEPKLISLAAAQSKHVFKHVRAFFLVGLIACLSLFMIHFISSVLKSDIWLNMVTYSCMITLVHSVTALIIYCLFLYDEYNQNSWPLLDDIVYYIKALTRAFEVVAAIGIILYGLSGSLSGGSNWINGPFLLLYCYFNVWLQLESGWKTFLKRREAMKCLEKFYEASPEQIEAVDDVCSICYQKFNTACITPCKHFFHRLCLRKWLFVNANCPLCHKKLTAHIILSHSEEDADRGNE